MEAAQDEMSERLAAVSEERDTYERETARQRDDIDFTYSNYIQVKISTATESGN